MYLLEPPEYICQLCKNGKIYWNLDLLNRHILEKHTLEKEITRETAKDYQRAIETTLDQQDLPMRIRKYIGILHSKNKNIHTVLGEFICRECTSDLQMFFSTS